MQIKTSTQTHTLGHSVSHKVVIYSFVCLINNININKLIIAACSRRLLQAERLHNWSGFSLYVLPTDSSTAPRTIHFCVVPRPSDVADNYASNNRNATWVAHIDDIIWFRFQWLHCDFDDSRIYHAQSRVAARHCFLIPSMINLWQRSARFGLVSTCGKQRATTWLGSTNHENRK